MGKASRGFNFAALGAVTLVVAGAAPSAAASHGSRPTTSSLPPLRGGEPIGSSRNSSRSGAATVPAPVLTVNPPVTTPSSSGQWQVLPYTAPGLAVHATVLNDGRVLLVEGSGNDPQQFAAGTFNVWVWNPQSGTFTNVQRLPLDLFCGGHAVLADGKVLFVGGTRGYPTKTQNLYLGTKAAYEFDPATNAFTRQADMASPRWYPSVLEQANGKALVISGGNKVDPGAQQPEVFDPTAGTWTQLPYFKLPLYPAITLLQNGLVFYSGAADNQSNAHAPGLWNPITNAFSAAPSLSDPANRDQAASLLLPPAQSQKFAVFGGGTTDGKLSAVADTDIFNLANPSTPVHSTGPSMAARKMHVLGVILPNETVFETGGGQGFAVNPVQEAAIYNPSTGSWTQMNPPSVPRTYHSEAILLPDGRVATLGSNPSGYAHELRIELFAPPYLFKGPRPSISSAPSSASYGSSYIINVSVPTGAGLSKLVLIKPGSVTHSTDPNQRLVELPFKGSGSMFNATIPSNPNLTPPGWYMLFAVDNQGRPSVARWVHVQ